MVDLREHEIKTLSTLAELGGKASGDELIKQSGMPDAAVMRSALTLKEKNLVQINEKRQTVARLNAEGNMYAKKGLPERQMVNALETSGGHAPLTQIVEKSNLKKQFIPIGLGWIQRKKWATLESKTGTLKMQRKADVGNDEVIRRNPYLFMEQRMVNGSIEVIYSFSFQG
jgi:phenylalanyl-tRNA synthetase alpha chain